MKKICSFLLALAILITTFSNTIYVSAESFEPGRSYTEEEIQQMRDEANTYENMSQKVSTQVFDWLNSDRIVFLNAQDGASGMGHSALLLLDNKDRGVFFSYYPIDSSLPESLNCEGDVRMKYLSQQDIRAFWTTGDIDNVVSSAWKNETITDGGYVRGIVKKLTADGSLIYEKMLEQFISPQQYQLFGNQCDDTALTLFCETQTEFLYIWGSTFTNPAPNVTYNHLTTLADGEKYNILADFLIYQRIAENGVAPSETSNEDAIAFGMYTGEHIDMPESLVISSRGVMPDGREYKKYYFKDQDVLGNENAVVSSGDLSTRYLICVGDTLIEEMYLLFAKAGDDVLGGQHDEIYRKVILGTETVEIPDWMVAQIPLAELINGVYHIRTYTLNHFGGSMYSVAMNALNSFNGYCANENEAQSENFLYWDASKGCVLSTAVWRDSIHYSERFSLNQDQLLPSNVAEALKQGFEKLPAEEAKYHQLNSDLDEYDYGASLKFVHKDGREAIYKIDTYSKDYENDISKNASASTLLKLESYPDVGPTFNYAPNDSAGSIVWWDLINRFSSFVSSKVSVNSVAHYYFDMLPYYWWGNTPKTSIHIHDEQVDEAVASTCQTYGLSEGSHCSLCGEIIEPQTFVPLASHKYVNGICSVCGKEEVVRYTVLVLDTSSSSTFFSGGVQIYEADTSIKYVKEAAKTFVDNLAKDDAKNYIAVISYKSTASITSNFTSNVESVKNKISNLSTSSNTRDISAGLKKANELLAAIDEDNVIKNVVLCTTGMTNHGSYDYNGDYDENTVGSNWCRTDTDVDLYAYANAALTEANKVKENANLYVLGLFQTMNEMPEEGKDVVDLFRLTAKDIASSEEYFYDIVDTDNISFKFGEVADDIIDKDTDGDGLFDSWELYGVDTDNDGVVDLRLDLMGADPNVPDIFVEVDWMVEPEENLLFITMQQEQSLAPSAASMYMVYEAFKKQRINLHIDVGPSSIDYVTGKPWGALSGGNEIAYVEYLNLNGSERGTFKGWENYANSQFSVNRRNVFKYCMFINRYEYEYFDEANSVWKISDKTSSGIASSIPGQYFIVANQKWVRDTGNVGVAGTFMHELGHTLGLSHGGFELVDNGDEKQYKANDDNYKPNYLSVMNYFFQMTGLVGTEKVDYSRYDLPDLDESALLEEIGIDPEGITAGTGLGTKIFMGIKVGKEVGPISKQEIDFNSLWGIESERIKFDLNHDGKYTILTSSTDWDHLIYTGGDVGSKKQVVNIQGISSPEAMLVANEVLTLEKALESNSLAKPGTIALEALGPYDLFNGLKSQNIYVRVLNMSSEETTVSLVIEASDIIDAQIIEITVPASTESISYVDVKFPIIQSPNAGAYLVHVIGTTEQGVSNDVYVPINVQTVTEDDLNELHEAILESDEEIPYTMLSEYENALEDCSIKGHTDGEWIIDTDATCTENGIKHQICSVCSDTIKTEIIVAEGHVNGEWIIDKEAEIGVAGEKHISCIKCGEVMETATIDPLPEESGTEPNPDDTTSPEDGETGTEPGEHETNPPITNNDNIIDSIADKIGVTSNQLLIIVGGTFVALIVLIIIVAKIKRKRY